jgi:diguanylate cyclase (GGDEF)-like protein
MKIKAKILGTFSVLLALALLYQAASYYLTIRSVACQSLLRGEVNERKLTFEAKHLFTHKMLAFSDYCLYPRSDYMDRVVYADKEFTDKLGELHRQLEVCGDPSQFALLKGIEDKDNIHNREAGLVYKIDGGAPGREAAISRIKHVEAAEASVMSALDDMGKETLGMITADKGAFPLFDRLSSLFPSFAPILASRDNLLTGVYDLWADLELDSISSMRSVASRRFLLTGDKKYISWHNALTEAFSRGIVYHLARLGKDDLAGRKALTDAKEFNGEIEAAFEKTAHVYRSGDQKGAEETLLHSFLTEQMLDTTLENKYTDDFKGFESAYASLVPVTEFAVSFNRQLLEVMSFIAFWVFITGYVFISIMVRPINDLREASRLIATGDWSQRLPVRSNDEIGEMAKSFNKMTEELEKSERKLLKSHCELRELALHDPLTGLANRRLMEVLLEKDFASAKRLEAPLSIVMMDIDYFKKYNDTFGHQAGDAILADVARITLREARGMDLVVRYGGEEFLLVLPDTNLQHGQTAAERIRAAVESRSPITVSLGVAAFDPCMKSHEELIKAADTALYKAKESGRNRVVAHERLQIRAA